MRRFGENTLLLRMNPQHLSRDSATGSGPIPYELRIGVTGHRDLANPAAVAAKLRELLDTLLETLEQAAADPFGPHGSPQSRTDRFDRRVAEALSAITSIVKPLEDWASNKSAAKWPRLRRVVRRSLWPSVPVSPRHPEQHQLTPIKLTAVSALARGADRIVVQVVGDVVRQQSMERNRFVEAVLPCPQAVYEQDFVETEDLDEFRSLLALDRGAANTHPHPTVCCPKFPASSDPAHPTGVLTREDAYAAAGRHVVDTSEILIAVWNPARQGRPGGTEETVRAALNRGRLVFWLNPTDVDSGVWVLRPVLPEIDSESTANDVQRDEPTRIPPDAPHGCLVAPVPTRAKDISLNLHRLAAYNRDAGVSAVSLQHGCQRETAELRREASACGLPDAVTLALAEHLLPRFVRADLLSQKYRRLRNMAARVWPTSAAFVVTLMAFQIVFLPSYYWLAFVELAVLVLGYASNRVSLHEAWHDKWLNDRRLAEGLRGATYAVLAAEDAGAPASAGGSRQRDPLPFYNPANAWYVASMKRELAKERRRFRDSLKLADSTHLRAVACFLQRAWILPQALHHRSNAQRRERLSKRAKPLRFGLFVSIVVVAMAHALGVGHPEAEAATDIRRLDLWLGFLTVALPAWAAAFHVMLSLDDHDRLAERSVRMAALLDGLAERVASAASAEEIRQRVAEADDIMDLESAEWAESLVDRRPEFTG